MNKKLIDLVKEAEKLTGEERAKLVTKDIQEKMLEDKKGFLSQEEINALTIFDNYSDHKEYEQYLILYKKTFIFLGEIERDYLRFKYLYENLKIAHWLICLSPAIDYLSCLVNEHVKNKKEREDALKITHMIQAVKAEGKNKLVFCDKIERIKEIIPVVHEQACRLFTLKKVLDRIREKLGPNFSWLNYFCKMYLIYLEDIKKCIKEHNRIFSDIVADHTKLTLGVLNGEEEDSKRLIADIKEYIIPQPFDIPDLYEELVKDLFHEPEDDEENEKNIEDTKKIDAI